VLKRAYKNSIRHAHKMLLAFLTKLPMIANGNSLEFTLVFFNCKKTLYTCSYPIRPYWVSF
jgi:hypothetical protein